MKKSHLFKECFAQYTLFQSSFTKICDVNVFNIFYIFMTYSGILQIRAWR